MRFVVYNTTTGQILRLGEAIDLDTLNAQAQAGETVVENTGDWDFTDYWNGSAFVARPALSTVATWDTTTIVGNGTSAATLGSGLPSTTKAVVTPSTDNVPPAKVFITTGSFVLTSNYPGTVEVVIEAFPYLTETTIITVT